MFRSRGELGEVNWHVAIRSLDEFPAVVALHRGPPNLGEKSIVWVRDVDPAFRRQEAGARLRRFPPF